MDEVDAVINIAYSGNEIDNLFGRDAYMEMVVNNLRGLINKFYQFRL